MSVNFSKSYDRNLRGVPRPQRVVRNCLTYGTRYITGPDDSGGRVHRAAIGNARKLLYALSYLEQATDLNSELSPNFCVLYVELDGELFAVFLGVYDASRDDGLEYAASGIMKLSGLPPALTRSSSFVARGSGGGRPQRAVNGDYAAMHDSGMPVASPYSHTPGFVADRNAPARARQGSEPGAPYGVPLPAP
jgi:hypothetical protein